MSNAPGQDVASGRVEADYRRLFIVAVIVLILDQVSKLWIVRAVPPGANPVDGGLIEVVPGFFYIIHVYNTGAAWGMFAGYSYILGLLGFVALAGIYFFRKYFELHRSFVQLAFGLLIGGIIGNMIDRFAYGHVVDFLDFHLGSYRYPAFNVADSGITVGVGLYIVWTVIEGFRSKKEEVEKTEAE